MSTEQQGTGNPLVHPYQVYSILNGEQNQHLAGAADMGSAVTLAAAAFIASQHQTNQIPLFFVYDDTGQAVAFIGDTERVV